jgi:ORF6N domain
MQVIKSIQNRIYEIRGQRVMLDKDLAALYEVPTKSLTLSVKRNIERFPRDFMFQLTKEEYEMLRFQIETSNRGGTRYMPYVFTEQGVAMLSGVINSKKAIDQYHEGIC